MPALSTVFHWGVKSTQQEEEIGKGIGATLEQSSMAHSEVGAVEPRRARPYGMAS